MLGQKKNSYDVLINDEFAPDHFVFRLHFNKFLWQKNRAPSSSIFRKNRQHEKHIFSALAEISDIDFWKKAQNRRFLGSPTSKIFFDKLSIKNSDTPKILVGTLLIDILWPIFEKTFLRLSLFFHFFLGKLQPNFVHLPQKIYFSEVFWGNHWWNLKNKNLKNAFSKIGPKMPIGGVPTKIFGASEFFYRKFVKKYFRSRGPPKSTIFGLFKKSMSEISANSEKTCFLCCRFFRKIEEMEVYFGGCALIFFFTKTV